MTYRRIRLLYIIDYLYSARAGTEKQLGYIIKGLNPDLFELHLLSLMDTDWLIENGPHMPCKVHRTNVHKFKNPLTYLDMLQMVSLIKKINPDIIHTFFPISNVVGILAGRLAGVRALVSSRRDYGQWMNPLSLFFTKLANKYVLRILSNSFNVRTFTSKKENFPMDRIDVLYNGVDLGRYHFLLSPPNGLRESLNIPEGHKVVGAVANLRPMKRLDNFLLAAEEILKKRSDISFVLLGRGPSEGSLRNLTKRLGIEKNVCFAGNQEDVTAYLSLFDVGVNCSAQEGLSNAIIEYMACGVAAIVSEAGGNNELIEDGINGIIFPLDDFEALASGIVRLLDGGELREAFRRKAREKVEALVAMDQMISRYETYYKTIIEAASSDT